MPMRIFACKALHSTSKAVVSSDIETERACALQESIASSAVRAADKVQASLIIVYTQTGHTASLVSKYRCTFSQGLRLRV